MDMKAHVGILFYKKKIAAEHPIYEILSLSFHYLYLKY